MSQNIDDELELKVFEPIFNIVEKAMVDALGFNIDLLSSKGKTTSLAFPRMIFSYICNEKGIPPKMIGKRIKRDRTTILAQLQSYDRYFGRDKTFTLLADAVIKRLKEIENGV